MGSSMSGDAGTDFSQLEVLTIDAIVGVFEGARPFYYGAIAASRKDAGGLSYGKHQVSHTSGNLYKLLDSYLGWENADPDLTKNLDKQIDKLKVPAKPTDKQKLAKWNETVEPKRLALIDDSQLKQLLAACADDPAMKRAQDKYFFDAYMKAALADVKSAGLKLPLSAAVAYDSCIQSGPGWWDNHRAEVDAKAGVTASAETEKQWIAAYVARRKAWMLEMAEQNPEKYGILRNTTYRMEAFEDLIRQDKWDLKLPLTVHGYTITAWDDFPEELFDEPFLRDGPEAFGVLEPSGKKWNGRSAFVQRCLRTLNLLNPGVAANGVFDEATAAAVRKYQGACGLEATGKVDTATFSRLCADANLARLNAGGASTPTSDGLKYVAPNKKKGDPWVTGGAAVVAAGGTAAAASTINGDQSGQTAEQTSPATTPVQPAPAPSAVQPAPVPVATGTAIAPASPLPTHTNLIDLPTVAVCAGFIGAVVIIALLCRRWA